MKEKTFALPFCNPVHHRNSQLFAIGKMAQPRRAQRQAAPHSPEPKYHDMHGRSVVLADALAIQGQLRQHTPSLIFEDVEEPHRTAVLLLALKILLQTIA